MATIATEVITTPRRLSLLAYLRQRWINLSAVPEGDLPETEFEARAARAAAITLREQVERYERRH